MQPEQPLPPQQPPQVPPSPLQQPVAESPQVVGQPMPVAEAPLQDVQPIQWQAPEYIQERRSPWWFIAFWVVTIILIAVAAFLIQSWSFAILVPAMAAALMIYSHRPPQMLSYVLSSKGIYINEKLHPMSEFRSFGILKDESLPSLMLIPVKRFRPGLTVHFPHESGEAIVDFLGQRIPMKELQLDALDKIVRKLRI